MGPVEQAFFLAGAVFLVSLTLAMARLGRGSGGVAWSFAWVCLYGGGLAALIARQYPLLQPAVPLLGTLFAAFLLGGSLLFAERVSRFPREFVGPVVAITVVRIAVQPFVSEATSQLLGSLVICAAVAASVRTLLMPPGRDAKPWERILGYALPSVAVASLTYSGNMAFGGSAATGLFAWLIVGNSIGFLQVAALIARTGERSERERATLATLIDAAPIGLLLSAPDGTIRAINRELADHAGLPDPQSLVGHPIDWLFTKFQASMDPVSALRFRQIRSELLRADFRLDEREVPLRDGRVAIGSTREVLSVDGSSLGRLWMLREVTEQVQLEEQLRRSRQLETLGRLAGGVAHDFNNKLTAVLGNASMLSESIDPMDPRQAALADLEDAAEYCADLTRDLLDFARQTPRALDAVDLDEFLIELVSRLCRDLAPEVQLECHIAPNTPAIAADRTQLERVITNLILNAVEAVRGRGHVSVDARPGQRNADHIDISVEDNGVGIDVETQDRIFDPFFSTKEVGEGTGLGLAIVFGIVTNHGGEVSMEGIPEGGSRFTTSWPRHRSERPVVGPAPPIEFQKANGTVLVVEDEAPVRRIVRATLEGVGFDVVEARTGEEAAELSRCHAGPFVLAIVDLSMPGISGSETLELLHKDRPRLPAIVISGRLGDPRELGLAYALAKPFRARDLLQTIQRALRAPNR